jgi:hypothetical protein
MINGGTPRIRKSIPRQRQTINDAGLPKTATITAASRYSSDTAKVSCATGRGANCTERALKAV